MTPFPLMRRTGAGSVRADGWAKRRTSVLWQGQGQHSAALLIAKLGGGDGRDATTVNRIADLNLFVCPIRLPDQRIAIGARSIDADQIGVRQVDCPAHRRLLCHRGLDRDARGRTGDFGFVIGLGLGARLGRGLRGLGRRLRFDGGIAAATGSRLRRSHGNLRFFGFEGLLAQGGSYCRLDSARQVARTWRRPARDRQRAGAVLAGVIKARCDQRGRAAGLARSFACRQHRFGSGLWPG
jgi:hypothetical protein